jgi:hypothetical protein
MGMASESAYCKTRGGEQKNANSADKLTPCFVEPPSLYSNTLYPLVEMGKAPNVPAPQGLEGRKPADPNKR